MSLAGYTLLILMIALTNAVLGFGGAMLLGYGPRISAVQLPLQQWFTALLAWQPRWPRRPQSGEAVASPEISEPRPASDDQTPLTLTPIHLATSDALPAAAPARSTFAVDENVSFEAALAELQREVAGVRNDIGSLDERVRTCSAAPSVEVVEECVADLKQTGQRLYQQQTQALCAVEEELESAGPTQSRSQAAEIVGGRADELRQSLARFDTWQVDPNNLADDCLRLLAATEQLMQSCDEVGEVLQSASAMPSEARDRAVNKPQVDVSHGISLQPIHGVARVGRA